MMPPNFVFFRQEKPDMKMDLNVKAAVALLFRSLLIVWPILSCF